MGRTREFDETAVMTKAMNLFWNRGYHAISTQDLIDAFGISRSSMYGAYKDKRSLFITALKHYRDTASKEMIKTIDQSATPVQTLAELFNTLAKETWSDKEQKGCFMVNTAVELAPHDKEIAGIVKQNRLDVEQAFERLILQGMEKGEIATGKDAKALSRFLFNTINGMRVDAKFVKDKKVFEDIVRVALSVLR